jgi:hypothetical protein
MDSSLEVAGDGLSDADDHAAAHQRSIAWIGVGESSMNPKTDPARMTMGCAR